MVEVVVDVAVDVVAKVLRRCGDDDRGCAKGGGGCSEGGGGAVMLDFFTNDVVPKVVNVAVDVVPKVVNVVPKVVDVVPKVLGGCVQGSGGCSEGGCKLRAFVPQALWNDRTSRENGTDTAYGGRDAHVRPRETSRRLCHPQKTVIFERRQQPA